MNADTLAKLTKLDVYPHSVVEGDGCHYFLARRDGQKVIGVVGPGCWEGLEEVAVTDDNQCICVGPADHRNAVELRQRVDWARPHCIGLDTSVGLGDRLGLATPGHVRAFRGTGLKAILAQQSIRELNRTQRTPEDVMDAATYGVLQEGYTGGFGSDADHLQHPQDIDLTYAAGFTFFTIDPGAHVVNEADTLDADALAARYEQLDFETLSTEPEDLRSIYVGERFELDGGDPIEFDEATFIKAAVKYGNAIAHVINMYQHLSDLADRPFELEVSVDETDSPTSPAEHYFFAAELKRAGVEWVSMAPRFIGRFEKGVDYIGDLDAFRASFSQHVAVMRTLGPYKISIHSGSDKFSIYPIVAELTDGLVHVKTAGTSYLEAIRAIAVIDADLFREIYTFARDRYEIDKKTYHVSADMTKVPPVDELADDQLAASIDQFDTRQALHVTFGSVLTAEDGQRFKTRIYDALQREEETHYAGLAHHLGRHVAPFAPTND